MNINTIFYFPDSLPFEEYKNKVDLGEISKRTIVFAKSQRCIYNEGKRYGGISLQEFNNLVDTLYDDSWISDEINNIKDDITLAAGRLNYFDTIVSGISSRLDTEISERDSNIQNKVEDLMDDSLWLQENFPQGVTSWDSRWDLNLEAYLLTVGYWTTDSNDLVITQWSKLSQSINNVEASVNDLRVNGNLTQALTASVQLLISNGIASLSLGTTYATIQKVDDVEKVLTWMYSGLLSSASENLTFSQMSSMAKSNFISAIADIRTQVDKVADGDFVAQTELSSKVGDIISTMILLSSSSNALAGMEARLNTVEQDTGNISLNLSSLILGVTGSNSTADLATRVANKLSGFTTSADITSAKSEIYSAINAKDGSNLFISLAALKTQADADHSSISGIATRVSDLETNEAGLLAKADLDQSVAALFARNSSTKSSVVTEVSNSLNSAKTEIYSAISAKDRNNNFISLASLKTLADTDHSSISGIATRVGTLETNQSGFVASSNLNSAVALMFASSGNGLNSTAKANIVALVKDNKSQLQLNATDVNINGYLSGGSATFKGDVQATSFTTGSENEIGIGVMSGEFNELIANTHKAYFAYDSTQGGITMWYYKNNEWKRLDLTSASVVDNPDAFQPITFYIIQNESIEVIPKNLPTVTLYLNRVTAKYYNTTNTSNPANGTYYTISGYGSGEGLMFYVDSIYKSDYSEGECDLCSIKEHKSNGTVVNSGAVSDSTNRLFSISKYTIVNGSVTSTASAYVMLAVSDIYVNSSGKVTNVIVAPVVVKFRSSHLMWSTTGTNYPLLTVTPTSGSLGTHSASVHAIALDGRRLNGTSSSSARTYADINWIRTSLLDAFNTSESPGSRYTNHVRAWLSHEKGTVKYPDSSGYPY